MHNIKLARSDINIEALDTDLRAALGKTTSGISAGPYGVIVHLDDHATPQQIAQAQSIVESHDPAMITPRQQAEQQRQQKLASMRSANGADLNPVDYSSKDTLTQALAQKLAWLEQEVLDLRGGGDV